MNGIVFVLSCVAGVFLLCSAWSFFYFRWENRRRRGMAYFGLDDAGRACLKRKIQVFSAPLRGLARLEAGFRKLRRASALIPSVESGSFTYPAFTCTPESLKQAFEFQAEASDVLAVTFMRSGTTWLQHLLCRILSSASPENTGILDKQPIAALSPWLESCDGISPARAPRFGPEAGRVIKTHLHASVCPAGKGARFVYLARHPGSCFRSLEDYFRLLAGPLAPPHGQLLDWFCSERMWWGHWPGHVAGWWERARADKRVLFLHYEELLVNPRMGIQRIAVHLGVTLTEEALDEIEEKTSFEFMKQHEHLFEMSPPNLFSAGGGFLRSGDIRRYDEASDEEKKSIRRFCREHLRETSYPWEKSYPDLARGSRRKRDEADQS